MKSLNVVMLGVALLLASANRSSGEDASQQKLAEPFQGEWIVTCWATGGYELSGTPDHPMTVVFTGNRMARNPVCSFATSFKTTLNKAGLKSEHLATYTLSDRDIETTFKLDASKTPNRINLSELKDGKPHELSGIYRFTEDGLELCIGGFGRPREFKATNSDVLVRLERKPPQQKLDVEDRASSKLDAKSADKVRAE